MPKNIKFVWGVMPMGQLEDADRVCGLGGVHRKGLGRGNVSSAALRCATKR